MVMWGTLSLLWLKGALLKMGVAQNPVGVAYHNNGDQPHDKSCKGCLHLQWSIIRALVLGDNCVSSSVPRPRKGMPNEEYDNGGD